MKRRRHVRNGRNVRHGRRSGRRERKELIRAKDPVRESALGIKSRLKAAGLNERFSGDLEKEAAAIASRKVTEADFRGRRDLRGQLIITIDGADSKDLDDAISLGETENGDYVLGVHIADVSEYVKMRSPLDEEAMERGNSVYFLDRVIPMLPKTISNGICSLFEGTPRLTLSCEMVIDRSGNIVSHDIYPSVIESKARMVYDDVSDMIEYGDEGLISVYSDKNGENVYEALLKMNELACILHDKRIREGSVDFDLDEAVIELGPDGIPTDVGVLDRRCANRMIEEFMLAANRTVAKHFRERKAPFIYRVHAKPESDKVRQLQEFLAGTGVSLKGKGGSVTSAELNRILDSVRGSDNEKVVATVMLHAMSKAYYSTDPLGHYGLGFRDYCHFTSPIRRYPDLMIHRIIKAILSGRSNDRTLAKYARYCDAAAEHSSVTEKNAMSLERDIEDIKKAEYMSMHVGEQFDGVISGVTSFGVFVELPNTIEGLIHVRNLGDERFLFHEDKYILTGSSTGRTYKLGDPIRITVKEARVYEGKIEFLPAD